MGRPSTALGAPPDHSQGRSILVGVRHAEPALPSPILAGRHVASLATLNPDSSIHMVAGVRFMVRWFTDFCGHVLPEPQGTEPAIQREGLVDD